MAEGNERIEGLTMDPFGARTTPAQGAAAAFGVRPAVTTRRAGRAALSDRQGSRSQEIEGLQGRYQGPIRRADPFPGLFPGTSRLRGQS